MSVAADCFKCKSGFDKVKGNFFVVGSEKEACKHQETLCLLCGIEYLSGNYKGKCVRCNALITSSVFFKRHSIARPSRWKPLRNVS